MVTSVTLVLLPVLYFFTFLYYTDPGSTFCVLLTYLLSLHSSHILAALCGVVAVLFRQTNIVWVAFCAGNIIVDKLREFYRPDKKEFADKEQNFSFVFDLMKQLFHCKSSVLLNLTWDIFTAVWPYLIVGLAFVAFIMINGSIVVGAKMDHQAALHFPQVFYFAAFTGIFSFMHLLSLSKIRQFAQFISHNFLLVATFCLISSALIWCFTYEHRYLLSDNRHYTFYVWSKIFRRHKLIKFALVPGYLYAIWSMSLALNKNVLWKMVFAICVAVNLVPSPLLEFRYFIIPYLIFRLNLPLASYTKLLMEISLYVACNVITLYLFVAKPFKWEGEEAEQRFMW